MDRPSIFRSLHSGVRSDEHDASDILYLQVNVIVQLTDHECAVLTWQRPLLATDCSSLCVGYCNCTFSFARSTSLLRRRRQSHHAEYLSRSALDAPLPRLRSPCSCEGAETIVHASWFLLQSIAIAYRFISYVISIRSHRRLVEIPAEVDRSRREWAACSPMLHCAR
jgi:hypothetical protein